MDIQENHKLLEQYRIRYNQDLERYYNYVNALEYEAADQCKNGTDDINYKYLIDQLAEGYDKIEQLKKILENPEALLIQGREDDLKANGRIMDTYSRAKEKYESRSLLQRIKLRFSDNQNERSR